MAFVFVPQHRHRPPSPLAEELSRRLAETIEAFRRERGEVSDHEIRQAIDLAKARTSKGTSSAARAILVAGILVVALLGVLLSQKSGGGNILALGSVLAVAIFLAALALALKSR